MRWVFFLVVFPSAAFTESYVALRTIPAKTVLVVADMTAVEAEIAGAVSDPAAVLGLEARVTVFAGRPILAADFVAPALVNRNQVVPLIYAQGNLTIVAEGRSLDRAGLGEMVRAMNLASRTTVSGIVTESGAIRVGQIHEGN
jgi:flagellar basal body P-ring formation protein FlgA